MNDSPLPPDRLGSLADLTAAQAGLMDSAITLLSHDSGDTWKLRFVGYLVA